LHHLTHGLYLLRVSGDTILPHQVAQEWELGAAEVTLRQLHEHVGFTQSFKYCLEMYKVVVTEDDNIINIDKHADPVEP
jgi:hypothetical protein